MYEIGTFMITSNALEHFQHWTYGFHVFSQKEISSVTYRSMICIWNVKKIINLLKRVIFGNEIMVVWNNVKCKISSKEGEVVQSNSKNDIHGKNVDVLYLLRFQVSLFLTFAGQRSILKSFTFINRTNWMVLSN